MSVIFQRVSAVLIPLFALSLAGCLDLGVSYSDKNQTIEVGHYKQQCNKTSATLCFVTRENEKSDYTVFENLNGFSSFQWGTRYSLKVETSFDKNGKPNQYQFRSVASEQADSNAFSLTLYTATNILTSSDQTNWSLAGEKNFTATAEQGSAIAAAVSDKKVVQLEFTAANNNLTLTKVKCSAAEDNFAANCEGTSTSTWRIAHFQSDCNQSSGNLCLIYRVNSSDDWELLRTDDGNISGFTPDWGKEYDIEVEKTVSNGGQLVSAKLKTNDETPEDKLDTANSFAFVLNGTFLSKSNSDNKIAMYDGGQILACDSRCAAINSAIDSDNLLLLVGYVQGTEVFVSAVECDENPGKDFDDCVKDYNDKTSGDDNDVSWWPPLN